MYYTVSIQLISLDLRHSSNYKGIFENFKILKNINKKI